MDNQLEIFKNPEFGSIRTILIDNEPWFVGKDVTSILEYQNSSKALRDHVDEEDKLNNKSLSSLGQRGGWIINESGLYSLILFSKLPKAKKFKHWVTSEILPSIRKTGSYAMMPDDELMARALLIADGRIKELKALTEKQAKKIKKDEPKVTFADAVMAADNDVKVRIIAKILCQNGVHIGQNRLFAWLAEHGYLIRTPNYYEVSQKAVNGKWLRMTVDIYTDNEGIDHLHYLVKVTPKGQIYFVNKILKENGYDPKEMDIDYSVSDLYPEVGHTSAILN